MKKMKTAVIVAVMMVMLFVTTVSTVSAAPTPCGAYNGTVTINGNLISESDPVSALHILVEVDGEIVGNDSVSMYIRGGKDCGVAVTGIHEGEDVTFYLKDLCGNKTVAETDPSSVKYFACDGKGHTVDLTFIEPTPTPEPTTTPEVTATPSGNGDGAGGGGGGRAATPTPTPTATATPAVTPSPTPTSAVTPLPTATPTATPTVPVEEEKRDYTLVIVAIIIAGIVAAGVLYWRRAQPKKK